MFIFVGSSPPFFPPTNMMPVWVSYKTALMKSVDYRLSQLILRFQNESVMVSPSNQPLTE